MWSRLKGLYADASAGRIPLPPGAQRALFVVHVGIVLYREAMRDKLPVRASQLAYWTTVAIVPLFLLAFAVTGALGLMKETQPAVQQFLLNTLIAGSAEGAVAVIDEITAAANVRTMGLVGIGGLMIFGLQLYTRAEQAYNDIFSVRLRRGMLQRLAFFYAGITLGPVLIAGGFVMTVRLEGVADPTLVQTFAPVLMTGTALILAIRTLPCTSVSWRAALVGGGASAALFEGGKWIFNLYTDLFGTQDALTVVYGSLGILPLFLLWLYVLWIIVLVGVEIAYITEHFDVLVDAQKRRAADPHANRRAPDALFGMAVLTSVLDRYRDGLGATSLEELSDVLGAAPYHVQLAIDVLVDAELLIETGEQHVVPVRPPEDVRASEVFRAWRELAVPVLLRESSGAEAAARGSDLIERALDTEPVFESTPYREAP